MALLCFHRILTTIIHAVALVSSEWSAVARAMACGLTALVPEGVVAEKAHSIGAVRTNYVPETGTASTSLDSAFLCDCPTATANRKL